mmetsp:Transcript_98883/g.313906  ORF Transcript_98883/g.313906 Transcript_98883/m.313906 type:complete len:239 (+) Transcript_98883:975-1691(+)
MHGSGCNLCRHRARAIAVDGQHCRGTLEVAEVNLQGLRSLVQVYDDDVSGVRAGGGRRGHCGCTTGEGERGREVLTLRQLPVHTASFVEPQQPLRGFLKEDLALCVVKPAGFCSGLESGGEAAFGKLRVDTLPCEEVGLLALQLPKVLAGLAPVGLAPTLRLLLLLRGHRPWAADQTARLPIAVMQDLLCGVASVPCHAGGGHRRGARAVRRRPASSDPRPSASTGILTAASEVRAAL